MGNRRENNRTRHGHHRETRKEGQLENKTLEKKRPRRALLPTQSKMFIQRTRVEQQQQQKQSQVAEDKSAWHLLPGHMTRVHALVSVTPSWGLLNRCSASLARCLSERSSFVILAILSAFVIISSCRL